MGVCVGLLFPEKNLNSCGKHAEFRIKEQRLFHSLSQKELQRKLKRKLIGSNALLAGVDYAFFGQKRMLYTRRIKTLNLCS